MTEIETITYFCIIDDIVKKLNLRQSPIEKASNSEILTIAVLAHTSFSGNYEKALETIREGFKHLFPSVPSLSRFSRRINNLLPYLQLVIQDLIELLPPSKLFAIDSKPIKVCENIRISRRKVLKGESFRGYIPSKREYFYGFRLHAIVDEKGFFREVQILEGSAHDLEGLAIMSLNWAKGCEIIGDRAYTNYSYEDELKTEDIKLNPIRKIKESRYEGEWVEYFKKRFRRIIETAFSVINRILGIRPYAPTKEGIILKIFMSVLSYNLNKGFKMGLWV